MAMTRRTLPFLLCFTLPMPAQHANYKQVVNTTNKILVNISIRLEAKPQLNFKIMFLS